MGTPDHPLNNTAGGYGNLFASLSVAPPAHSIEVSGPVSCVDSGDKAKVCTLTGTGNVAVVFRFASTSANFYGTMYHVFTRGDFINPSYGQVQGCDNFGALHPSLAVPEQVLTYALTVAPPVGAPSAPTVTSTSCTVGTSLELAFTSTDPNGHHLRFGLDWDDDGYVDQFVPPSGSEVTAEALARKGRPEGPLV